MLCGKSLTVSEYFCVLQTVQGRSLLDALPLHLNPMVSFTAFTSTPYCMCVCISMHGPIFDGRCLVLPYVIWLFNIAHSKCANKDRCLECLSCTSYSQFYRLIALIYQKTGWQGSYITSLSEVRWHILSWMANSVNECSMDHKFI